MKNLSLGDTDKKTFAEKTIQELNLRKMSFVTLADGVGENVSTIKQCLYGNRKIKTVTAKKICNFLHLDFNEMIKDDAYLSSLNSVEYTTFGEKFGHFIEANNLNYSDVAENIGVSRTTIFNIIKDKNETRKDTLVKLCGTYNLDFYEMIKDDPKYSDFANNFEGNTNLSSLFRKVGINSFMPEYENILINLINDNKNLFLPNNNETTKN